MAPALALLTNLSLTHFQSLLVFAIVVSIAFGFIARRRPIDRVKTIAWSLFWFLLAAIGIGWVMYPYSR